MQRRWLLPFAALPCGALLLAGGCRTGDARFAGDVGGRAFEPVGTVFHYVDAHDDDLLEDPRPRVVVAMTWLTFDPTGDLADLGGAALSDLRHEHGLRDALSLTFDDQAELVVGANYERIDVPGSEPGDDDLRVRLHLAPERLSADSSYDDYTPLASRREVRVHIDEATFAGSARLAGTVEVTFVRTDDDPADARIGRLEGTFDAPGVEERVAEHNLALLGADTTLGLPLPAREP